MFLITFYAAAANATSKSKKTTKDPNAPKRPQTAFFQFMAENRERIIEENPGIANTDISKKGGEMWKKLDENKRKEYDQNYKDAMVKWKVDFQKYQNSDAAKEFQKSVSAGASKSKRTTEWFKFSKKRMKLVLYFDFFNHFLRKQKSSSKKVTPTKVTSKSVKSQEFVSDSDSSSGADNNKDSDSDSSSSDSD